MKIADRVKQTTNSTSMATIDLAETPSSFRSFAAAFTVGDTEIPVGVDDRWGRWENGFYTLTSANTLTRTAIHSSSNAGQAVTFLTGEKDVFCALTSGALNDLIDDLRAEIGGASSGGRDIAFATTVPLNVAGQAYMPQQRVAGPLTFTVAANAVRGALVYLRLVADGANTPNFTALKEWGGSLGYDNRNGIVNEVQFFHDGYDPYVSISQAVNAVPLPAVATAVTLTGPTGVTVSTASAPYTVGTNGARTASVIVTPTPVSGVTFNPTSITLPTGSATATFTATASSIGAKTIAVTNNAGLTNPANITLTVTASATVPAAPTIGAATAGDGYVDVAFTVGSNGGSAITNNTATLSTGESASGTSSPIRVTASNGTARTATVTSTNNVGTGAASAVSNSVTPTASSTPAESLRLNPLVGLTESASAPYTYTGQGGAFQSPQTGVLTKSRQTGVSGNFAFTAANPGGDRFPLIGLHTANAAVSYTEMTLYFFGTVSSYNSAGPNRTAGTALAPETGDILRLRWSGTTVYGEVARAATPTVFAVVATWITVSDTARYCMVSCNSSLLMTNVNGAGLA